jgi:hypothetical protein
MLEANGTLTTRKKQRLKSKTDFIRFFLSVPRSDDAVCYSVSANPEDYEAAYSNLFSFDKRIWPGICETPSS